MPNITFKQNPVQLLGQEVRVGDKAPDFTVLANDLSAVSLNDYKGKKLIVSSVPSLDTPVCDQQTRKFNEEAANLDNTVVLTVSVDLPFAQKRWCGSEGLEDVITLSDHRDLSFGQAFGTAIESLRLLTRAVFVIDTEGKVTYVEYVPEVTDEPNYDKALEAAKQAQ